MSALSRHGDDQAAYQKEQRRRFHGDSLFAMLNERSFDPKENLSSAVAQVNNAFSTSEGFFGARPSV
jgi:hypothetical protein